MACGDKLPWFLDRDSSAPGEAAEDMQNLKDPPHL